MGELDLMAAGLREVNRHLQSLDRGANDLDWRVVNPKGAHAIAVGLDVPARVLVAGHAGFYCGGMNKQAEITIEGHAGPVIFVVCCTPATQQIDLHQTHRIDVGVSQHDCAL